MSAPDLGAAERRPNAHGPGSSSGDADRDALDRLRVEHDALRKEILRLRDQVIGKDAELATAHGRLAELEALVERYRNMESRLDAVLSSRSWRLAQTVGTPLRLLRRRRG